MCAAYTKKQIPFLSRLCCFMSPKKPQMVLPPLSTGDTISTGSNSRKPGEFDKVFRYFDEDGDGKISPAELRNCMKIVGEELTEDEAEAIVTSSDTDGDGLLAFEEFVKLVDGQGEEEKCRTLMEAFKMYEMEGKGCITPKSLKRALGRLGECKSMEDCKKMIRSFDLNGDGVISFEEFRIMMI
ncbi:calcium-binding protein CML protein [Dioscorea alata]|uniref:Calcium-binding protein CML protein n=1 Tax=Dioscorea alata TaxID=55571 RepID=A0ACB7WML6_DIOAL|nr:calcium-binding protein CML protein [Dioscorea alata]